MVTSRRQSHLTKTILFPIISAVVKYKKKGKKNTGSVRSSVLRKMIMSKWKERGGEKSRFPVLEEEWAPLWVGAGMVFESVWGMRTCSVVRALAEVGTKEQDAKPLRNVNSTVARLWNSSVPPVHRFPFSLSPSLSLLLSLSLPSLYGTAVTQSARGGDLYSEIVRDIKGEWTNMKERRRAERACRDVEKRSERLSFEGEW